jgi:hypothetical protein
MASITPTLSNFTIEPRVIIRDVSFSLIDPSSDNTNPAAVFTFKSSNTSVADISGRIVRIQGIVGETTITATQAATTGFTSAEITAVLTVNPVIESFTITPKEWNLGSFELQNPASSSTGLFTFESLTPNTISIFGRVVTLKSVGRAQIKASQDASGIYPTSSVTATFDVLTSIVRIGTQNQVDLSWNIPTENGGTIKNYFFYTEERKTDTIPAPPVSTILETSSPSNSSYYSYALPDPYSTQVISATGQPTGIDINFVPISFNITTLPQYTTSNYFDIGYYGEIEVSWVYHNDYPIEELLPNEVTSTVMTLSIHKRSSVELGDNRIDLILNASRNYDSLVNCYGPMPQNNDKTMVDIFVIDFPGGSTLARELKYMKPTDVISGEVKLTNNTYINSSGVVKTYSIILKSIRIAPFRFPISRDFTSLGFGIGTGNKNGGFSVSTFNALRDISGGGGVLYHMPKMTHQLTDYGKASWTFSWKYAANLAKLTTDISFLPVGGSITNLNIPFNMRIRAYSRPYAKTNASISDASYNTLSVPAFLTNISNANYNTRALFDLSFNSDASYNQIFADSSANTMSYTFDIPSATGFPLFVEGGGGLDYSHTQFVFIFDLNIHDPSYNAYFRMMNTEANSFQVKMLSQTFTPYQQYRFEGPDPTLASSNSLTSLTNTSYKITDYYTPLIPYYQLFDLSNGVFYSYRIASQNIAGTSAFSGLLTRRCGSIPNTIINQLNSAGAETFTIESERTSNRVNIYWDKPSFSGYEIQKFIIQMMIDISGRWVNFLEYTPELTADVLSFDMFENIIVPITDQTKTSYDRTIAQYTYNSVASQQYFNTRVGLSTPFSGSLLNGYKYYFRLASENELGYSAYSSILSGIPFARPNNAPIRFVGDQIIGNELIIITWKIPQDDAGSPILNYIIDYQEVTETLFPNNVTLTKYNNKIRYIQDSTEHDLKIRTERQSKNYPIDNFREVYSGYKKFSSLNLDNQELLKTLRKEITKYIIYPRPITLDDPDKALNLPSSDLSKNIIMNFTNKTFSYKSNLLDQNIFDLSYIQLKWYYTQDTTGGGAAWLSSDISLSFHLSIRGHLKDISGNTDRDISGIFDISRSYIVTSSNLSNPPQLFNYINSITGDVIENGQFASNVPATYVRFETLSPPTLIRIDAGTIVNKRYYLSLDYEISNFSRSDYKFNFYSGKVILNGIAPVRTYAGLNTEFTMTLKSNIYSPLVNGKKYLFTITPFNINDFFPDPSTDGNNYGNGISQTTITVGTDFSEPITDMSYSLISTSQGGKVLLQWKYSTTPKYYINIIIPDEYKKDNVYPQEYPLSVFDDTSRSILTPSLDPSFGIVSYMIPSNLQSDIDSLNAQLYLKSGRGYHISVQPVQTFIDNQGATQFIPAPPRNMFADGTYIIPFRTPLRPLEFISQGYDGYVDLRWRIPDITNDPNYYKPDTISSYYQYKYFTLERRELSLDWMVVSNDIVIPSAENGGVAGYQAQYNVSGLTNERPQQFRIRIVILNEYTGQKSFSDYTYMTIINNVPQVESSGNTVYASIYPFRPNNPSLRFANIVSTEFGPLNGLRFMIDYPSYNGTADYYECDVEYNYIVSGSTRSQWYGIFDVNNGIADLSDNITINGAQFTTNRKLRTTTAAVSGNQTITVVGRTNLYSYGIRFRLYPRKNGLDGVYPLGDSLYTEYSNVAYLY